MTRIVALTLALVMIAPAAEAADHNVTNTTPTGTRPSSSCWGKRVRPTDAHNRTTINRFTAPNPDFMRREEQATHARPPGLDSRPRRRTESRA
jgi:hypothetical protein